MKACSPLFNAIYREVGHVGSSYEHLRLEGAGDFDLNLVLDFDVLAKNIRLEFGPEVRPGFTNVVVMDWDSVEIPGSHELHG